MAVEFPHLGSLEYELWKERHWRETSRGTPFEAIINWFYLDGVNYQPEQLKDALNQWLETFGNGLTSQGISDTPDKDGRYWASIHHEAYPHHASLICVKDVHLT